MARRLLFLAVLQGSFGAAAATRDNDDSCDISLLPAATLLLPYFEVDLDGYPGGRTTHVSITNVTNLDRVAHVTLWTDSAYPVLDFNIYLTGYDVQRLDLFDVIARGVVAPETGGTGTQFPRRRTPTSDPNPELDHADCKHLPGNLDVAVVRRMQRAFGDGVTDDCAAIGGDHSPYAIGYATIDVVNSCIATGPTDPEYWTRDLRYDNVLVGDYQIVEDDRDRDHGAPLVHIRAIPEGGTPELRRRAGVDAGFARTFYGRYQPADAPRLDGRQPLPSQFAARWIDSGTTFHVWRETEAFATCADFARTRVLDATDIVAFDEDENAAGLSSPFTLPASSATSFDDGRFPALPNGAAAGWMYMNLDAGLHGRTATQNWVVTTMRAANLTTSVDAAALANGCAPAAVASNVTLAGGEPIAPAGGDDSCDIALLPAATLLLPYFEVDLDSPAGERTLLTITNTAPREQLARVTLWTDFSWPVLTFNVRLTGHDVQSLSLFDVLSGKLAASGCGQGQLAPAMIARMRDAFVNGRSDECRHIGTTSSKHAVGYVTIDVVRNCESRGPDDPAYWTTDLAYDNVLTGDYQQLNLTALAAEGSPMVHIRAVPEAEFRRTFYGSYQSPAFPARDARQPLPSAFAVRWSGFPPQGVTSLQIWREGTRNTSAAAPTTTGTCCTSARRCASTSRRIRPPTIPTAARWPAAFSTACYPSPRARSTATTASSRNSAITPHRAGCSSTWRGRRGSSSRRAMTGAIP
jgi:hypothetical protein